MNLKRILLLVVLALVHLPGMARAADTEYCGTKWPFWWRYDGPRTDIVAKGWEIEPVGDVFRISFSLVNQGSATFEGGVRYVVTHAAVDHEGYKDPTSLAPPANARSLLGAEVVASGELPRLSPGQSAMVEASAQGFRTDANHILTVIVYDSGQVSADPSPTPWYWLRILSPRAIPGAVELLRAEVEPVSSSLEGYKASRVLLTLQNTSRTVLEAGTPISLIHGSSGSARGNWGPDDIIDPNNPGNPYASFFREALFEGRLERPLYPGEVIEVGGVAHIPEGFISLKQMTVSIGE
jgi:hypothetical protein